MIAIGRRIGGSLLGGVRRLPAFRLDRRAVTAIEYAMIAGIMVVALVLSVPAIGPALANIFNNVAQHL